jgi:putative membrane protein
MYPLATLARILSEGNLAMPTDALLAYFHFIALIGTVSFLVVEAVLCRPGLGSELAHRLRRVDTAYAMCAVLALVTGLLRLFWGAKGSAFYTGNPVFHAKMTVYVAVALLSILPTVRFIGWSKAAQATGRGPDDAAVQSVRRILVAELVLVALLPLLATLMARGVGH